MDTKVLLEILKTISGAIMDAMFIATAQTLGLQQLRREAAIDSAPRGSLTEEAKRKLRLSSFTSKLLFDRQAGAIFKVNMAENQKTLIRNAVSYQAKPNPSASSKKRESFGASKRKNKPQETSKKDFSFPIPRPPKRGSSSRGSSSRGRGGGPSHGGASASKKHWSSVSTAPASSKHSGGRKIGPLCPKLGKDHRRRVGPFFGKKGLQNSISKASNSVTRPSLLPAASKSAAGRRSRQSPLKGGSGGDNSGMSRILLQNFPRSQEERETQADYRPLCAQSFCLHTDTQNG